MVAFRLRRIREYAVSRLQYPGDVYMRTCKGALSTSATGSQPSTGVFRAVVQGAFSDARTLRR